MNAQADDVLLPLLREQLRHDGFAFAKADAMASLLGPLPDFDDFAASWERLAPDTYLAARGRQRRRRHATFRVDETGAITQAPHQAHYQSLAYNTLQGDIERWFEPGRELLVVSSAEEATAAYQALLDDPGRADEMGRAARERALDEHTYLHRARQLLALLGVRDEVAVG